MTTYPVRFEADYIEPRSRATTFFRLILAIPHMIWLCIYGLAAYVVVVLAWFAILFTGRYPQGMYDFVAGFTRYWVKASGYIALITDDYPSFSGGPDPDYPIRMDFAGPLPEYSRAKTFFRMIIAIPLLFMRYVMGLLVQIGAVGAWFVIVALGRQPQGLHEILVLGSSYTARSDAYLFLLTETYPPFRDDMAIATSTHTPLDRGDGIALGGPVAGLPGREPEPGGQL